MSKPLLILIAAACCSVPFAQAQSVTTESVGFNKITCLANSDTIVGVPLRKQGSISTKLTATPSATTGNVTLTLANTELPTLAKHFLKFNSGNRDGRWYDILSNTASTVTIDLNGDNLDGVLSGDSVLIAEYWTLDTLFPPAQATTNPATTGHAIVASSSVLSRKTELLLPNLTGQGTNLAPSATYYITSNVWKKFGDTTRPSFGDVILYPDNYFIVRHNSTVTQSTVFKSIGEIEAKNFSIFLSTRASGKQDNFIGLPRPVAVKLVDLGLDETAFVNSPSTLARKDELLVFNNDAAIRNKAPSATYYRLAAGWRKFNDGSTDHNNTTIPAGAGFLIRKAATATGASVLWKNTSAY
jgi:uncharacterized protein (TIGR02597 family)